MVGCAFHSLYSTALSIRKPVGKKADRHSCRLYAAMKRQTLTLVVYLEASQIVGCVIHAMFRQTVFIMGKLFLSKITDNGWDRIPSPLNMNIVFYPLPRTRVAQAE